VADIETVVIKRKTPKQPRAQETIETILQATAHILTEEGSERLTTNYLARKAGFSIGTVYQYFPNKESIILALIDRQRDEVSRRIGSIMENGGKIDPELRIRQIIAVLHQAFNVHRMPQPRLVQSLLRLASAHGLPAPSDTAARAITKIWMETESGGTTRFSEADIFVLSCSLFEVLRQAALQSSTLLGTEGLEDALARLVFGFLRNDEPTEGN
jgi:AcrR family transcriptional regulator